MDQNILNLIVAICVILLTVVFYLFYRRVQSTRRTVLIMGLCDSGKTLIFSRLIHSKFVNTYTSIQENKGVYETKKGKSVEIVDIPGQERLRDKFLEQFMKQTKGYVFVIDSLTLQKEIRDVADYLYNLLTNPELISCNVLIFCNKQDHTTAKGMLVIKSILEKELQTIRETKGHSLKSTDGTTEEGVFLGVKDMDFKFEHLIPGIVDFGEGYALNKENDQENPNLTYIEDWLEAMA